GTLLPVYRWKVLIMTEPVYGVIRRCVRHDMREGCEASRDDCLVELLPTRVPDARFLSESPGLPLEDTE
ncbi:MAG TPA: hypothetical protein VFR23_17895, partial [Jiangellaceae bacterium]|nr:hypothetical protein [Jiangellaceae bacterium]